MALARRDLVVCAGLALLLPLATANGQSTKLDLAALEKRVGGRIGVAARDTRSGAKITWRGGERFAMCSTFKWFLAAAVLARCEEGRLSLDRSLRFFPGGFLPHSPVTSAHAREGAMRVEALCEAAVEISDNTAANTLLLALGGPPALTGWLRQIGDTVTRLDRFELALNENLPGDPRDTTTPEAMIATMQHVLLGDVLAPRSRALLVGWMRNCQTGLDRLRAGFPRRWIVADKTGTGTGSGSTSAANDLALAWPTDRQPVVIASFISGSSQSPAQQNSAHAEIARTVSAILA